MEIIDHLKATCSPPPAGRLLSRPKGRLPFYLPSGTWKFLLRHLHTKTARRRNVCTLQHSTTVVTVGSWTCTRTFESEILIVGAWQGHIRSQNGTELSTSHGRWPRPNDAATAKTAATTSGSFKCYPADSTIDISDRHGTDWTDHGLANPGAGPRTYWSNL